MDPNGPTPQPAYSGQLPTTVRELIAQLHRQATRDWDRSMAASDAYFDGTPMDRTSFTTAHDELSKAWVQSSRSMAKSWAALASMIHFARANPVAAEAYRADLVNALEAGDMFGEWLWQWGCDLVTGEELSLPGDPFPSAPA